MKNQKNILSLLIIVLLTFGILFTFWAINKANFDIRKQAGGIPISTPPGEPKVICTVTAFLDDPRNNPPGYYEITSIKTVKP